MAQRITIKEYCRQNGYNMVKDVQINVSGYKFVTLADSTGIVPPENLYLGQRFGETVEKGHRLDLNNLWVVETVNASNEIRLKLSDQSGEMTEAVKATYQAI